MSQDARAARPPPDHHLASDDAKNRGLLHVCRERRGCARSTLGLVRLPLSGSSNESTLTSVSQLILIVAVPLVGALVPNIRSGGHRHLRTIVGHIGVEFPSLVLTQNRGEYLYNHHRVLQLDYFAVMGLQHIIQSTRR